MYKKRSYRKLLGRAKEKDKISQRLMGELETLRGIASALEVPCPFEFQDSFIRELTIDSRRVVMPTQSLFFAISGVIIGVIHSLINGRE